MNKLSGYGSFFHHQNSVRLNWIPDFKIPGSIKIYGYTYDELETKTKFRFLYITTVKVDETYNATIESAGNKYILTVNGVRIEMVNNNPDPKEVKYLFPYFGGTNSAPNDMTIEIEYL